MNDWVNLLPTRIMIGDNVPDGCIFNVRKCAVTKFIGQLIGESGVMLHRHDKACEPESLFWTIIADPQLVLSRGVKPAHNSDRAETRSKGCSGIALEIWPGLLNTPLNCLNTKRFGPFSVPWD